MKVDLIAAGTRMGEAADLARQVRDAGWSGIAFAEGGRTAYLSCGVAATACPTSTTRPRWRWPSPAAR